MIKTLECSDGTVYAVSNRKKISVNELIDFLEKHRDKKFTIIADNVVSFRIKDNTIACNESYFFTEDANDLHDDETADMVVDFIESKGRNY